MYPTHACPCPTFAVTEMLVNVLNIHSEDDDDEPTEAGGEGGVRVRVRVRVRVGSEDEWELDRCS